MRQKPAAKNLRNRKNGQVYADGIAVGVVCCGDAQDGATSTLEDHMVILTPTALPSAYDSCQTHRISTRGSLGRRHCRRRIGGADGDVRRPFCGSHCWVADGDGYADGSFRTPTASYADADTPTAIVATPTAARRRRFDCFP